MITPPNSIRATSAVTIKSLLFPVEPRSFAAQRWLNITLRALHLLGITGIGGGFLFALPEGQWHPYWYLTLISGGGLMLLYLWSSALWLLQLKGVVILAKLLLLALALYLPAWRAELFALVVLASALIAHAQGRVRGWRCIGGEVGLPPRQP